MKAFKYAQTIITTLGLDSLTPCYSAITFALAEKTQGKLGAYINSSGQLVAPNGLASGTTLTAPNIGAATGTSLATTGALTTSGGPLGFTTGAGGAVTQITSITAGVTLSKPTGQITTVSSTLAAAASVVFTVTNTLVAATDVPQVAVGTYAGAGTPIAAVKNVVAGAFDVVLFNAHATAALNAAVIINFDLMKGVAA